MKKSLIALIAITFAALPVLNSVANAETAKAAKQTKIYQAKLLKPAKTKFALEQFGKTKSKVPFVYDGPRDAFFINGIN